MLRIGPLISLLRLQLRILTSNRAACMVVLLLFVAAFVVGRPKPPTDDGTCYVLYWDEDSWVERLRAEIPPRGMDDPRIDVRPVEQFLDSRGVICYPRGAHSIQLRPPDGSRSHWLVWYWYSGSNPQAMDAAVDWFWKVTHDHFHEAVPLHVRVSPLETGVPLMRSMRIGLLDHVEDSSKRCIVWAALFFCGCYLPMVSISQQRERGTILSLIVTPAGWRSVAVAMCLFHAALTLVAVGLIVAFLDLGGISANLWMAMVCGVTSYLGVAFFIASWCNSVASAGAGLSLYLMVGGLAPALSHFFPSNWIAGLGGLSIEAQLFTVLGSAASGPNVPQVCGLVLGATFFGLLGIASFRHRIRLC